MKLGLSGTRSILSAIGDPQSDFESVHIAGTNGKGSTAACVESVLHAAGLRVGLYTSPHLVDVRERFRVNKRLVSKRLLIDLLDTLEQHYDDHTFFEVTTALAFRLFSEERVEIVVAETGLGGRLDSTNVLVPRVCAITSIDREHTEILGRDLTSIAREKAGIIKPGVPVVCTEKRERLRGLVRKFAEARRAPFVDGVSGVRVAVREERLDGTVFDLKTPHRDYSGLRLSLAGRHQVRNAMCATLTLEQLALQGYTITENHLRSGLADVKWDGRLQVVGEKPLVLCDVAHNPAAARTLTDVLKRLLPGRKAATVYGGLADKDHRRSIRALAEVAARFVFCTPPAKRAQDAQQLAKYARSVNALVVPDVAEAAAEAKRGLKRNEYVLVCGSHYTVGAYLAHLRGVPPSPV
jgi:dihydrofolate synthase/folylpolyglutamate synthase